MTMCINAFLSTNSVQCYYTLLLLLQVFLCKDEDNDCHLAVKEVWIDPNFSNDTRQVCLVIVRY